MKEEKRKEEKGKEEKQSKPFVEKLGEGLKGAGEKIAEAGKSLGEKVSKIGEKAGEKLTTSGKDIKENSLKAQQAEATDKLSEAAKQVIGVVEKVKETQAK